MNIVRSRLLRTPMALVPTPVHLSAGKPRHYAAPRTANQEDEVLPALGPYYPRPASSPLPSLKGQTSKDLSLPHDPRGHKSHSHQLLRQIDVDMRQRLDIDNRADLFRKNHPNALQPGSILLIEQITSRSRPRSQVFAGVLIAIRRKGVMTNIVLRNYVLGTGVEMVIPVFSPSVKRIRVLKKVTDMTEGDNIYWLRDKPSSSPMAFTKIDEMVVRDREQERRARKASSAR
ncbi:translation protein SH3-like domain-containing protein [Gaertneriomyces semiglobifer]|nr:translation protein SH3-like domain-containing protein [Gaertneriomyces semiglobifer]